MKNAQSDKILIGPLVFTEVQYDKLMLLLLFLVFKVFRQVPADDNWVMD